MCCFNLESNQSKIIKLKIVKNRTQDIFNSRQKPIMSPFDIIGYNVSKTKECT